MVYNREGYAPWSLTREAGIESATVDGTIEVPQYIQPVLDTGFVDEKGDWKGRKSSDRSFIGLTKAESIPNGGEVLFPDTNAHPSINMSGFNNIFIALKTTRSGNVSITAVGGPDTIPFANLQPVNSGETLRAFKTLASGSSDRTEVVLDSSEAITQDVWDFFYIPQRCSDQQNMQFKIVNNSGGTADIEFGYQRVV